MLNKTLWIGQCDDVTRGETGKTLPSPDAITRSLVVRLPRSHPSSDPPLLRLLHTRRTTLPSIHFQALSH